VVNGNLIWSGSLSENMTEINATIKATKLGLWEIYGYAGGSVDTGKFGNGDVFFIDVKEDSATISREGPVEPSSGRYRKE
jgi:hypothetical protein